MPPYGTKDGPVSAEREASTIAPSPNSARFKIAEGETADQPPAVAVSYLETHNVQVAEPGANGFC